MWGAACHGVPRGALVPCPTVTGTEADSAGAERSYWGATKHYTHVSLFPGLQAWDHNPPAGMSSPVQVNAAVKFPSSCYPCSSAGHRACRAQGKWLLSPPLLLHSEGSLSPTVQLQWRCAVPNPTWLCPELCSARERGKGRGKVGESGRKWGTQCH